MQVNPWWLVALATLCAAILATTVGCAEKRATTRPEPSAVPVPTPRAAAEPAEANDILMHMAVFLAGTSRFSVNIRGNYDVVQESGQKIEFGEVRRITVSRPNRLRVEAEHSNGETHFVFYDGKHITAFSPSQNVYAQTYKPGGIDQAIMYFLRDLHMRLPLAALLLSRAPDELERRTRSLDYVERTSIDGMPTHHLAGRTETVDYQIWIADAIQPLPLRAVLTYKNAEGQPQFRAQFLDWNLSPEIEDSRFAFTPPQGARRISFLAQLPPVAVQGTTTPEPSGRRK